jgi:hypothetical protein
MNRSAAKYFIGVLSILFLASCDSSEPTRSLSVLMEDGTSVAATLQLRRGGCVENNTPIDCYFYIVKIYPRVNFDPETNGLGSPANKDHCGYFTRVHLSFYDSDGFSLSAGSFAPGWNSNPDELTKIDGGWQWKGRIGINDIPPAQFPKVVEMTAKLGKEEC